MATVLTPKSCPKSLLHHSIYYTLRFFFILLLFIGFFPATGIFASPEKLSFKWFSWEVIYSLYILFSLCMIFGLALHYQVVVKDSEMDISTSNKLLIYFFIERSHFRTFYFFYHCDNIVDIFHPTGYEMAKAYKKMVST